MGSKLNGNRWIYHTTTDDPTFRLILPIVNKEDGRNCYEEYGCDQLYNGDKVEVEDVGETYIVRGISPFGAFGSPQLSQPNFT
jgi:hypothetical protein